MKIAITFSFLILVVVVALAQQPAQYSLYRFNKYAFNPAYAGLDNSLSVTGVYRSQWGGLPGGPVSQHFNAHMPMYILGGGVGMGVENETLGSWRQTAFMASYAKQFQVGKASLLSFGLSAGLVQRLLDASKVRTPSSTVDDFGAVSQNDNSITGNDQGGIGPTVHAGVFYQGKNFELGISAINLLGNELDLSGIEFQQERTYFLYTGYRLDLTKSIVVTPSVLVKTDVHQTQIDFSLTAQYNENIFVGGSLRGYNTNSIDAVALIGGFKLNEKISVGYAYDIAVSSLKNVNTGSHEILLNYNLGVPIGKGRAPSIIYNPRSL
ncbi:MAG: type IX secretion system membrane protein PorP/SprF [Saprospiraceae bacterium]|jgi:type IX secretion system PorP/SprF family membrane protein|nr:type IX secretion system membrane protein PorP/SprF [Saprospiraceae bacterium]